MADRRKPGDALQKATRISSGNNDLKMFELSDLLDESQAKRDEQEFLKAHPGSGDINLDVTQRKPGRNPYLPAYADPGSEGFALKAGNEGNLGGMVGGMIGGLPEGLNPGAISMLLKQMGLEVPPGLAQKAAGLFDEGGRSLGPEASSPALGQSGLNEFAPLLEKAKAFIDPFWKSAAHKFGR